MNIELQYTSKEAAKRYGETGPSYGSKDAAAIDLRAAVSEVITLLPGEQILIPTGIKLNMNAAEYAGNFRMAAIALPRSGKGTKEGLVLANTAGLIDQDYQGEIMMACWARPTSGHISIHRLGGNPVHIEPWERIAQLMFVPVLRVGFNVVSEFTAATARSEGGFGHTGSN